MREQSEVYGSRIDWYLNVQMPDGYSMAVPQAKLLVGGSSINGGTALKSTEADSKEASRNDAWSVVGVHKAYQSLENDAVRGIRGLHPIVRLSEEEMGRIQEALVNGATQNCFESVLDLDAIGAEEVGSPPVRRQDDSRVSAVNAFIDPVCHQKSLTIFPCTLVDRVTFSGGGATGVLLSSGQQLQASHKVILCAGAIVPQQSFNVPGSVYRISSALIASRW